MSEEPEYKPMALQRGMLVFDWQDPCVGLITIEWPAPDGTIEITTRDGTFHRTNIRFLRPADVGQALRAGFLPDVMRLDQDTSMEGTVFLTKEELALMVKPYVEGLHQTMVGGKQITTIIFAGPKFFQFMREAEHAIKKRLPAPEEPLLEPIPLHMLEEVMASAAGITKELGIGKAKKRMVLFDEDMFVKTFLPCYLGACQGYAKREKENRDVETTVETDESDPDKRRTPDSE